MTLAPNSMAPTTAATLATQLQSLRLRRGWNMDRVAASAGISRTTLFHLERGAIRRPRASTLHKLAEALAVPIESLLIKEPGRAAPPRVERVVGQRAGDSTAEVAEVAESQSRRVAGVSVDVGSLPLTTHYSPTHHSLFDGAAPPFYDAAPPAPPCKGGGREMRSAGDAAARRAFDRATNPCVARLAGEQPDLFTGWLAEDWDELYSQFGVGGPLSEEGVLAATQRININRDAVYRLRVVMQTHLADVACALVETLYRQVCVSPGDEVVADRDVGDTWDKGILTVGSTRESSSETVS